MHRCSVLLKKIVINETFNGNGIQHLVRQSDIQATPTIDFESRLDKEQLPFFTARAMLALQALY